MELDDVAAVDLFDHGGKHVLSEIHQVIVVSIGHIKLTSGVLGVMSLIDRLVSEVLADFEDSLKTPNNTLLQE